MRKIPSLLFLAAHLVIAGVSGISAAHGQTSPRGAQDANKRPKHGVKNAGKEQRGVTPVDSVQASASSVGPYYALVIGNNKYRSLPELKTAVYDATEVAKLLQERYGFSQPNVLVNATRTQIMVALNQYRHTLPAKSNLLIYFAGHGQLDPQTKKAYWLPVDAERNSDVNWISASTITEEISAMPSQHVLIISDSCYSGALGESTRSFPRDNPVEHAAYIKRMLESPSRTLMASGRDEPVADDGAEGHSRFAYELLKSLKQIDDDTFTAAYLFQLYIQQAVGGELGSQQLPQYAPILGSGHVWGDFVFSRKSGFKQPADPGRPQGTIRTESDNGTPSTVIHDSKAGEGPAGPAHHLPSTTSEAQRNADREAINDTLRRYQEAFEMRDAEALWKIWPESSLKIRQNIDRAFKSAVSIKMSITHEIPDIAPDGDHATVKGQYSQLFTPKDGGPQPARNGDIVFLLKRSDAVWTITDVK